ncbi:hypothetical protein M5K25_017066 [Dendrobium thyrsiflorum]|uniref:Pentatricopeptide repeat-containing protein n=1 Tax=Dendrobium thyrsiflorum TaxID=117978 RepID=A0ABD0UM55_DENTH
MRGLVSNQTSLSLLKIISKTKNLRLGKSIHAKLIISNFCDIIESNYLIDIYAKCGHLTSARQVFDLMPNRNVVSYSSLMAGYFHDGCPSEFSHPVLICKLSKWDNSVTLMSSNPD